MSTYGSRAFAENEVAEAEERKLRALRRRVRCRYGPEGLAAVERVYARSLQATSMRGQNPPRLSLLRWAADAYARGDVLT